MVIQELIQNFLQTKVSSETIYNEFSLQHELGIFLRENLKNQKVEFERNISFFEFSKDDFVKKEIDISIYNKDKNLCAIELKFPRNGQYPEQMFSFCKDIKFLEQLKSKFEKCYFLLIVDDKNFYSSKLLKDGIYQYFRTENLSQISTLKGKIEKPTLNSSSKEFTLTGKYKIVWEDFSNLKDWRYCLLEI
ncbi:hypothetical protein [Aliarcobacter lanthieri]|uniref:hypothetical protein n=1 Tax=Aliarcobacter lanthieri TaxID=1355374 RepID=UPI003AADA8E7